MLTDHLDLAALQTIARSGPPAAFARALEAQVWPALFAETMISAELEQITGNRPGIAAVWRHRGILDVEPVLVKPHLILYRRGDLRAWAEKTGRPWNEPTEEPTP